MFSNYPLPMRTGNKQQIKSGMLTALAALLLSSCAAPAYNPQAPALLEQSKKTVENKLPASRSSTLNLQDRLAFPGKQSATPIAAAEPVYSFKARNMEINSALRLFATAYKLNIVADKEVNGTVSVAFHSLPFDQSMQAILGSLGYFWEEDNGLIRVRQIDQRIFTINYLRMSRTEEGSHQATVSSTSSGGSSGGSSSGGAQGSKFSIAHSDEIAFWKELEEQLKTMVSKADYARVIVNKMSGTIQVVDDHSHVEAISMFLNKLNQAIHRQIAIEVQIVEVTLNEDFNFGIDWTALDNSLTGFVFDVTTGNIITTALAGTAATVNPLNATVGYNSSNGNKFSSIVNALEEQGDVNIVSKPHIRTLNNQPALIKVGTDRTFFSRKTVVTATAAGTTNNVNDTAQVITEGIVLSITPQISEDNWVMMDVSPVLTRVISESVTADGLSTAPNVDVRQSTSIVRVKNGETIILGGLIQELDSQTERKVPGLGDIPAVGKAFSGTRQVKQKKELIIFLTPRIVGAVKAIEEAKL